MIYLLRYSLPLCCLLLTAFDMIAKPLPSIFACTSDMESAVVTCNFSVLLEGAYDPSTESMKTELRQAGQIPNLQPYHHSYWNYDGQEQIIALPAGMVDWVLLSFRESLTSGCIARKAAALMEDGTIEPFDIILPPNLSSVHVMVEHRNHLPVITEQPIPITNGALTFDFTQTEGYTGGGSGQKQLGNHWGLMAGNGDQNAATGYDLNAVDIAYWNPLNGLFNIYHPADYNMDNDVSADDRVLWGANNGKFSGVTKLNCGYSPPPNIPTELQSLTLTAIFEDNFDAQSDFANGLGNPNSNGTAAEACRSGFEAACATLPTCWDVFASGERFHPAIIANASAQPGLQINDFEPRGGTGKSLIIWDESYGTNSQWGSDALLGKKFLPGYDDIYAEMWIKFQPNYRWQYMETTKGINYAKVLRMSHSDSDPISTGGNGTNAPMTILDIKVWCDDFFNGPRTNRMALQAQVRCDPQETNYQCPGRNFGLTGNISVPGVPGINGDAAFLDTFGNGEWHKIGMRMALNSAPGVEDGILMVWYDDQLVSSSTIVTFLETGAPQDHLITTVLLGGNMNNVVEPEANQFEQWYAIDDVRIFSVQ